MLPCICEYRVFLYPFAENMLIAKKGLTMNETIERLKPFLLDYVQEITELSRNGSRNQYICPLCNSGTGSHRSGAFTVYPDTNSYHCFACDANGDIFNLYGEVNHTPPHKPPAVKVLTAPWRQFYLLLLLYPMRIDLSSLDIKIAAIIWAKVFGVLVVEVCHNDTLFSPVYNNYLFIDYWNKCYLIVAVTFAFSSYLT